MDITLALGGGGVRGYAHVGVIRVLEREGFRIKAIAGTSAGGLVGTVYLAGYSPDEIEEHMFHIDQKSLFRRAPGALPSLLGLGGLAEELGKLVGDRTFDDLKRPLAMVAVDLKSGREVVLRSGRLVDAVLATAAVPGIFPPKEVGDYWLVDGAVTNPVPTSVARALVPGLPVVSVVLSAPPHPMEELEMPNIFGPIPFLQQITRLRVAQAFNVFARSAEISSSLLTELHLDLDKPDVIIRPDVSEIGMLEEADVHAIIELGEKAAEANLEDLRRAVSWRGRVARRFGMYDRLMGDKER